MLHLLKAFLTTLELVPVSVQAYMVYYLLVFLFFILKGFFCSINYGIHKRDLFVGLIVDR